MVACEWDTTNFLVVSQNVFDPFIYYSHIVPLIVSLTIGFFILYKSPKLLLTRILFSVTTLFSVWVFLDLILWATDKPHYTIFFWSAVNLVEPFIYAAGLYFVQVFIKGKDTSLKSKIFTLLPLLPFIVLVSTKFTLLGYDLSNCNREAIEGPLTHYAYLVEIFYTLWVVVFAMENFRKIKDKITRQKITLVTVGIILFLLTFSFGNIIGSITDDWRVPQWGLFGMPIFIAFLSYLIVKYKTFDIKLIATQALSIGLSILIGSQFFFIKSAGNQVLNGVTFFISVVGGIFLVRSVKREVEQREQIQDLAERLKGVNSILSHDVKAVLGKNKDMFNALVSGDFGVVREDAKSFLQQSFIDTKNLITSIMTILESGHDLILKPSSFDFKAVLLTVVEPLRKEAAAKGLTLTTNISEADFRVIADEAEITAHVLQNLIANAVNYTLKGTIEVGLTRTSEEKILFKVKDTGVGISDDDKEKLFKEGGHGKDSRKINVHSTGYGLFIAKQIVDAHGGRIWAQSAGEGKGSTFYVELPMAFSGTARAK